MKRIAFAVVLIICLAVPVLAQEKAVDETDMKAIEQAALDYVQGYFEGSGERIERGLNPEFHKVVVRALPNGRELLLLTSRSMLIEGANAGMGKDLEKAKAVKVEILSVFKNTASVRIDSPDFIDLAHIAKINGQWQVVNVLWAPSK
jgi:hypothetical protein